MTSFVANVSTSVDGCVVGPNATRENPLGDGGERITGWMFDLASWREQQGLDGREVNRDSEVFAESVENVGAVVMGRRIPSMDGLRHRQPLSPIGSGVLSN